MAASLALAENKKIVSYWPKTTTKDGKPKDPNFGPKFVKLAMPWFEQFWHEKSRYPSDSEIIGRFGCPLEQVKLLNRHRFWLQALDRRGIGRPGAPLDFLSDKQIAAISLLTNFNIVESPNEKLASLGVSEEELDGWYKNPIFAQALSARADTVLGNVASDATVELARGIKRGDFRFIKFYYEITGQAQSPDAINVKRAMQVLIEAVQKHVKDDAVLEAIASEVQTMRTIQGL